jgi:hypothetical protein
MVIPEILERTNCFKEKKNCISLQAITESRRWSKGEVILQFEVMESLGIDFPLWNPDLPNQSTQCAEKKFQILCSSPNR